MARIDLERLSPHGAGPGFGLLAPEPEVVTLLDLVAAVADFADSDAEVIAVVLHLVESGRVRLIGQFREDDLPASSQSAAAVSRSASTT